MGTWATGSREGPIPCGFTLFELLAVLFVLGLFASLLTLRIEGAVTGGDLRLASRMIIGEITRLRGKAAYTHKEYSLTLNVTEETLLPSDAPSKETGLAEQSVFHDPASLRSLSLPKGVDLQDVVILAAGKRQEGEEKIRFFANGTVDGALIHLRNERDETRTLEIRPLTGNVVLHDGYIEQKTVS